jgi:hypothetical protein
MLFLVDENIFLFKSIFMSTISTTLKSLQPLILFVALAFTACKKDPDPGKFDRPQPHPTGVPALSGQLDRSKLTMTSVMKWTSTATLQGYPSSKAPIKGTLSGMCVWMSQTLTGTKAWAKFCSKADKCRQWMPCLHPNRYSSDKILGNAPVEFAGTVDFSPLRKLVPALPVSSS